ncbi:hypothetical protein GUJ93_ZPchr0002g25995 [Zizania palustris]|uniref:Uncharacterized protein n=1 Tax=Zizania palustris TaxID=103762 RepID=A0A8J5V9U2_ZIZPA|nr:hypothetical protein GUJ93_ZPchr0002g25995 [Zizania palustris]
MGGEGAGGHGGAGTTPRHGRVGHDIDVETTKATEEEEKSPPPASPRLRRPPPFSPSPRSADRQAQAREVPGGRVSSRWQQCGFAYCELG